MDAVLRRCKLTDSVRWNTEVGLIWLVLKLTGCCFWGGGGRCVKGKCLRWRRWETWEGILKPPRELLAVEQYEAEIVFTLPSTATGNGSQYNLPQVFYCLVLKIIVMVHLDEKLRKDMFLSEERRVDVLSKLYRDAILHGHSNQSLSSLYCRTWKKDDE